MVQQCVCWKHKTEVLLRFSYNMWLHYRQCTCDIGLIRRCLHLLRIKETMGFSPAYFILLLLSLRMQTPCGACVMVASSQTEYIVYNIFILRLLRCAWLGSLFGPLVAIKILSYNVTLSRLCALLNPCITQEFTTSMQLFSWVSKPYLIAKFQQPLIVSQYLKF